MSKSQGIKQNTKSGGNHPQPADVGFQAFCAKYRMVKKIIENGHDQAIEMKGTVAKDGKTLPNAKQMYQINPN